MSNSILKKGMKAEIYNRTIDGRPFEEGKAELKEFVRSDSDGEWWKVSFDVEFQGQTYTRFVCYRNIIEGK